MAAMVAIETKARPCGAFSEREIRTPTNSEHVNPFRPGLLYDAKDPDVD